MLVDIDHSNTSRAVAILCEGFASRPAAFWADVLDRIHRFGGNVAAGVAVGQLLVVDEKDVGIMLTPARERVMPDGSRSPAINLSSWFILPEHRWRAPLMMQSVLRQKASVVTDLSPTASVQKILTAMGFAPINAGESLVPLPLAALTRKSNARICEIDPVARSGDETLDRLLECCRFGCIAATMEVEGTSYPLLFKRRKVRGLPAAQLVYCENNCKALENLDAIARFLLRQKQLILILDIPLSGSAPGLNRYQRGRKFAKGHLDPNVTDYTGTELCLFDL